MSEVLGDEWPDGNRHIGTGRLYQHSLMRSIQYTDGVKDMAETLSAFWLIDLIASHHPKVRQTKEISRFCVWVLERKDDGSAEAACYPDLPGEPVISQKMEFTTFPYRKQKFYLVEGVLMLPSEY